MCYDSSTWQRTQVRNTPCCFPALLLAFRFQRNAQRTRARWFAAEFLVIVTGVLVAVGLNGFYQRTLDHRNEATYLALLSRDIESTTSQLEEKLVFEAAQINEGVTAYRGLSSGKRPVNPAEVSLALSNLGTRRTMALRDATYQDLLSTGNLRLIRNRALRDQIVDYYGATEAEYDIMNRNNSFFVDNLYNEVVVGKGLVKPGITAANVSRLSGLEARLAPLLKTGYITEPDYLWSLPDNAPEWAELKATLLIRIRIAAVSEEFAKQVMARTRALSAALEAERKK